MATRTTKAELEAEITRLRAIISDQNRRIDELREIGLTSEARQKLQMELDAAHAYERVLKGINERLEAENAALRKQLAELSDHVRPQSRLGRKSTVTDEMKSEIRARSAAGQSIRMIAEALGIGKSTVHRVLQG